LGINVRNKLGVARTVAGIAGSVAWERLTPTPRFVESSEVPRSAEAITPDWLTSLLCRTVSGAFVTDVQVVGGDNGTSARRALTVSYNQAGASAGLPTRLFSKSTATFGSRMLLGVTGIAEGESVFYNEIRADLELRSPFAYYSGYDARSHRSLLLLEDLSARGWTFPDPMHNVVARSDAEDMVAEMATYHAAFWDSPRFATDLAPLRPSLAWQENLNRTVGFQKRTLTGLERAKDAVPASLFGKRHRVYPCFMKSLELHRASPNTLLHQDPHLGNWLRDETGRMGLYDWQCVARGHWALDYSYALAAALAIDDRREWEEDLLRLYLTQLKERAVTSVPSFDAAWLAYRQQVMHGLVFGLFTLGGSRFEPELQPQEYTLDAIERIAQHAVDLDALNALSDHR
jgi:thiamine kinase-like enzyme